MDATNDFQTLRQKIRRSGRQFRHNYDTSESIFNPEQGFAYGYDIVAVESALDAYERTLDNKFAIGGRVSMEPEDVLREQAELIHDTHPSLDARALAEGVIAYLDRARRNVRPVTILRVVETGQSKDDLDSN